MADLEQKDLDAYFDQWFTLQLVDHQKNYCLTHRLYKGAVSCWKCVGVEKPQADPASMEWKSIKLPKHLR